MGIKYRLTAFLLFYNYVAFANTNQNQNIEPRDIIIKSLQNSGNYESIKTLKIKNERKNYNKWQNYSFNKPVPTNDESYREIDFENKQLYFKTISRYGGGYVFEFVTAGSDSVIYNYDANKSRSGNKLTKGDKKVLENNLLSLSTYLPYYNLKSLLSLQDSLTALDENENLIVTRHLKNGTKQDYHFNKKDYSLLKIKNNLPGQVIDTWFKDYTNKKGIVYPKKIDVFVNNEPLTKDDIKELIWNEPFNTSLLKIPAEYVVSNLPTEMKVSEIKKDVFLIEYVQGRNILFVNLKDGILVTEAPLSGDISKSIISLIKKTIPGKPIKYVHLSHFHNDHTHGIRAFVHEGATIITTPATANALKEVINDNTGRYNDDLAKNRKEAKFELFEKEKIIKDDEHTIEFYSVPSKHAEGISFLDLPKEKIIYQGDLYSLPDDGFVTPAIETTKDFYKFLNQNKISFERMIGHHGSGFITPAILHTAVTMKKD